MKHYLEIDSNTERILSDIDEQYSDGLINRKEMIYKSIDILAKNIDDNGINLLAIMKS